MIQKLDVIRQNAQEGTGPCEGCSAQCASEGRLVNPGLGNPDGEVMFVTDEPRHPTDWSKYDSWEEYNEEWMRRFANARGGRFINRLLSRTNYRLGDAWVADSIKCPTSPDENRGIPGADTDDAYSHCRAYLEAEFGRVDPQAVVTLGKGATIRTLRALGVPVSQAKSVRVTKEYGTADFDTAYPLVISLHWAQRTVAEDEWVPMVQEAISQALQSSSL
ncbi:Uracil-DNA glycosylase [Halopelagius inordinatus]|uniref:Uracil-DNA glycosylase n=1 Tax=Halopelagius inordinatus TaxID=553467 RepID=A0A1I2R6S4_9EURY|nr:hypothetical protein [Halopelagius inordinatus]SFG35209.1 Uracil-DNA glycosylase [Halopelagius inordinatus]